jgi:integrase
MASFRKRGGKWQVQVRRSGAPSISRSFALKVDADRWVRKVETEIDKADLVQDRECLKKITLEDLLVRYKDQVTPRKKSVQQETYRINRILRHPISGTSLRLLSTGMFARFRDERLKKVGPQMVRHDLNLLSHVLKIAKVEWDIPIEKNPLDDLKKPSTPKSRDRRLLDGELEKIEDACKGTRSTFLVPMIRVAIETGMRKGEIMSLKCQDVDLEKSVLHLSDTKNGESRLPTH